MSARLIPTCRKSLEQAVKTCNRFVSKLFLLTREELPLKEGGINLPKKQQREKQEGFDKGGKKFKREGGLSELHI